MANIPNGDYFIIPANNISNALDVSKSNFTNGSNIQVWTNLYNDAQIWTVTTRDDDTVQIASRYCGKCLDVLNGSIKEGSNIQLYDDNDTIAQQWMLEPNMQTISINGTLYTTYNICIKDTILNMTVESSSAGANVSLSKSHNTDALWAFIPIPDIRDGGIYELRTMVNTANTLSVAGSGVANGANVYVNPASGSNDQKWIIKKDGDAYSLRNVLSNKFLDVASAEAADKANVHIWEENDTRAQRWKVNEYGYTKIDGQECLIVSLGSLVTPDGDTYFLDVSKASTTSADVWIYSKNLTYAQRFALYRTEATDSRMATPSDLGITKSNTIGREPFAICGDERYITWKSSAAWSADNSNHYEIRTRTRDMTTYSVWGNWEDWTAWKSAVVYRGKQQCWYTDGRNITDDYDWTQAKNKQIEIQVRAAGINEFSLLHGPYIDEVVNLYREPNVELSAEWTADGLTFDWLTDYTLGTNYINIKEITYKDKVIFNDNEVLSGSHENGSQVLERKLLKHWINNGDTIEVEYTLGYDQKQDLQRKHKEVLTINYANGYERLLPVFTRDGAHLYATVKDLGQTRMYVACGNELVECIELSKEDGNVTFEVLYPTDGREFYVYTEGQNEGGTIWGTGINTYKMETIAYAFTTKEGKTLYLNVFYNELPTYAYSKEAPYQANKLGRRQYDSVSIGTTKTQTTTVIGALIEDITNETVDDFEEILGEHVVFRDIHGGIQNAAIIAINVVRHELFDEISLDLIRETI